jgi:hypothetical protein
MPVCRAKLGTARLGAASAAHSATPANEWTHIEVFVRRALVMLSSLLAIPCGICLVIVE